MGQAYHGPCRALGVLGRHVHAAHLSADSIQLELVTARGPLWQSERGVCGVWHYELGYGCGGFDDAYSKFAGAQNGLLPEGVFASDFCCWFSVSVSKFPYLRGIGMNM